MIRAAPENVQCSGSSWKVGRHRGDRLGIKGRTVIFCLNNQRLVWGLKLWKMTSKISNQIRILDSFLACLFFVCVPLLCSYLWVCTYFKYSFHNPVDFGPLWPLTAGIISFLRSFLWSGLEEGLSDKGVVSYLVCLGRKHVFLWFILIAHWIILYAMVDC